MKKPKITKLERSIGAKLMGIKRLRQQIADERDESAAFITKLETRIKMKEFLLNGLKNGDIAP